MDNANDRVLKFREIWRQQTILTLTDICPAATLSE